MALNIHQKISFCSGLIVFILLLYEQLFHLLLGIGHILFESVEYLLDLVIDHFFEVGARETEVVVFYILLCLIVYKTYKFYRSLPKVLCQFKQFLNQQKAETLAQWQELSIHWKMAWSSFFLMMINGWLFLM